MPTSLTAAAPIFDRGKKCPPDQHLQIKKKDPVTGDRISSGKHAFDVLCEALGIEYRLIPPRHPQTNGMVERLNGRISGIAGQTRFGSAPELESTLCNGLKIYNNITPKCALEHQTPIQTLQS